MSKFPPVDTEISAYTGRPGPDPHTGRVNLRDSERLRAEARALRAVADRLDDLAHNINLGVRPGDHVRCIDGGMFRGLSTGKIYVVNEGSDGQPVIHSAGGYEVAANDHALFERLIDQPHSPRGVPPVGDKERPR